MRCVSTWGMRAPGRSGNGQVLRQKRAKCAGNGKEAGASGTEHAERSRRREQAGARWAGRAGCLSASAPPSSEAAGAYYTKE